MAMSRYWPGYVESQIICQLSWWTWSLDQVQSPPAPLCQTLLHSEHLSSTCQYDDSLESCRGWEGGDCSPPHLSEKWKKLTMTVNIDIDISVCMCVCLCHGEEKSRRLPILVYSKHPSSTPTLVLCSARKLNSCQGILDTMPIFWLLNRTLQVIMALFWSVIKMNSSDCLHCWVSQLTRPQSCWQSLI